MTTAFRSPDRVTTGSGRSRNSSTWYDGQRGRPSRCVGLTPQIGHRTTGSTDNPDRASPRRE